MIRRVRLRHLLSVREETDRADLEVLSVYRDHGVVPKSSRDDNFNKTPEGLDRYQRVAIDDLVVNKMKAWSGSLAISRYEGIVSPDYLVCRLRPEVHPSYLHHLLRSAPLVAEMRARSKGIRPSQERLYWEDLREIAVDLPPLDEQRRIADFLDAETVRIERLIELREQHLVLNAERHKAEWSMLLMDLAPMEQWLPLRRLLLSISDGPFGSSLTSQHYSPEGARVVRLGNIGLGTFRDEDAAYIDLVYFGQLRAHEVKSGDLVIAGLGDGAKPLGRACVVPDNLGPAIVKADCFRVRLSESVDPVYAAYAISAPPVTNRTALLSRGATRERINTEVARDIRIPLVSRAKQVDFVRAVREAEFHSDVSAGLVGRQINLLAERRQALITAAVTGHLDVATARGAA